MILFTFIAIRYTTSHISCHFVIIIMFSQPGWVLCDNAICDSEPITEDTANGDISYTKDGKLVPFVKCQCWAPSNSVYSILPEPTTGAGCVFGLKDYGGEAMVRFNLVRLHNFF